MYLHKLRGGGHGDICRRCISRAPTKGGKYRRREIRARESVEREMEREMRRNAGGVTRAISTTRPCPSS